MCAIVLWEKNTWKHFKGVHGLLSQPPFSKAGPALGICLSKASAPQRCCKFSVESFPLFYCSCLQKVSPKDWPKSYLLTITFLPVLATYPFPMQSVVLSIYKCLWPSHCFLSRLNDSSLLNFFHMSRFINFSLFFCLSWTLRHLLSLKPCCP